MESYGSHVKKKKTKKSKQTIQTTPNQHTKEALTN